MSFYPLLRLVGMLVQQSSRMLLDGINDNNTEAPRSTKSRGK